jgi:hypothetical protein
MSTKSHQCKSIILSPRPAVTGIKVKLGKNETGLFFKELGVPEFQLTRDTLLKKNPRDIWLGGMTQGFFNHKFFDEHERTSEEISRQFTGVIYTNGQQVNVVFETRRLMRVNEDGRDAPPPEMVRTNREVKGIGNTIHYRTESDDDVCIQTLSKTNLTRNDMHNCRILALDPGVKQQVVVEIERGEDLNGGRKTWKEVNTFVLRTNQISQEGYVVRLRNHANKHINMPLMSHFSNLSTVSLTHPSIEIANLFITTLNHCSWLMHCICSQGCPSLPKSVLEVIMSFLPQEEQLTDCEFHFLEKENDKYKGLSLKSKIGRIAILQRFWNGVVNSSSEDNNRPPLLLIGNAAGNFDVAQGGPPIPVPMSDLIRLAICAFDNNVVFIDEFRSSQLHPTNGDGTLCMTEFHHPRTKTIYDNGKIGYKCIRGFKFCPKCNAYVDRDKSGASGIWLNGAEDSPQYQRDTDEGKRRLSKIPKTIPSQTPYQSARSQKKLQVIHNLVNSSQTWTNDFFACESFDDVLSLFGHHGGIKWSMTTRVNVIFRTLCAINDAKKKLVSHLCNVIEEYFGCP